MRMRASRLLCLFLALVLAAGAIPLAAHLANAAGESYVTGDVNGDGKVDDTDVNLLSNYVKGWDGAEAGIKNMAAADLDRDGRIGNSDVTILTRAAKAWVGYDEYLVTESESTSPGAPTIILQTESGTLDYVTTVLPLAVVADGGRKPYTYSWSAGSSVIEDADSSILYVGSAGNYSCTVTDAEGNSVRSKTIKVVYDPTIPLTIARQPDDTPYYTGIPCELTVEAAHGYEPYTYQWYMVPNTFFAAEDGYACDFRFVEEATLKLDASMSETALTPTLDVKSLTIPKDLSFRTVALYDGEVLMPITNYYYRLTNSAKYYCVITDSRGNSVQSDGAFVRFVTDFYTTEPTLTVDRELGEERGSVIRRNVGVYVYQSLADLTKDYAYQWSKDGSLISGASGSDGTSGRAIYAPVTGPGRYWAVIDEDPVNKKSAEFIYFLTKQPEDAYVAPDAAAEMSVTAGSPGTGPFTYQWQRCTPKRTHVILTWKKHPTEDFVIPDKLEYVLRSGEWSDLEGETGAKLTTSETGEYRCLVTDADGHVNCSDPAYVFRRFSTDTPHYSPSSDALTVEWGGGSGLYSVFLQKNTVGWWQDVTLTGHIYTISSGQDVIPTQLSGEYIDEYRAAVHEVRLQKGPGEYRFRVKDLLTGEERYSPSLTIN